MTFTEKLARLTEGGRTKLAKTAHLPKSAISNYISKKQMPRGDKALVIARALNVPIEWLLDDSQDWPPPPAGVVASLTIEQLAHELGRRMAGMAALLLVKLERARKMDWLSIAKQLQKCAGEPELPPEMLERAILVGQISKFFEGLRDFSPEIPYEENMPKELTEHLRLGDKLSLTEIVELFDQVHQLPGFWAARRLLTPYLMPKNWRGPWFKEHMEYEKGIAAESLDDDERRVKLQNERTQSRLMIPKISQKKPSSHK